MSSSANSPLGAVLELLDRSPDPQVWLPLSRELSKNPENPLGNDVRAGLTSGSFAWLEANSAVRGRILDAAQRYLREVDPQNDSWFGTGHFSAAAVGGYRAMQFVLEEDSERLDRLTNDHLAKWIPIVLKFPASLVTQAPAARALSSYVYRRSPSTLIDYLKQVVRTEDSDGPIFVLHRLESCWDDRLAGGLLDLVRDGSLSPRGISALLRVLISTHSQDALAYAETVIGGHGDPDSRNRELALAAAGAVMSGAPRAGWSIVWPAILRDDAFGRDLILAEVSASDSQTIFLEQRLSEQQLADFYGWLVKTFPYSEDPQERGAHHVGAREGAAHLRDGILRSLQARGTAESVISIRQLGVEHPELPWLTRVLRDAAIQFRRNSWSPAAPRRLLQLAESAERRIVTNGPQLLSVIEDSVRRFERKLQRETPLAFLLWNELPNGTLRPKEEAAFSDFLKSHLHDDLVDRLIIVNREVQIRRRQGAIPGQTTDIHVATTETDKRGRGVDSILAIIEVKGCWNPGLLKAMQDQLRDRYLIDNGTRYGLYVVGWYGSDEWDGADTRRAQVPKWSLAEAQARLSEEAVKLSSETTFLRAVVVDCGLH